ncbi:hypothetical protein BDM02DRAFT_92140 [Thelephora ganbajun]|uniref:Uncharacterized protein n=1 Tax=Thelephora ganbajun TaxID=370292 RepID=A0ACB6ZZ31_THEGA|nr:hypothetical protein BDM02DRAFT_92140 [Thelephora ganbajun]
MISSSFPGGAYSPSSSRLKYGSGSNTATQTFMPFGRYADVGSHKIKNSHPGLRLHSWFFSSPRFRQKLTNCTQVGSASTLYLNKGTLLGKDITYLSQVWNVWDAELTQAFYEQLLPYIHPETLRPLMGICAPTVIGIYSAAAGRSSLAMELPHPVGWRQADPYISAELKEKVIIAYQNIHARNILHNDVKLENILIGDDEKVTIVDFCKMVVDPEPADLALEMRIVKFMLDYDGAKEAEYERLRSAETWVETLRTAKGQMLAVEVESGAPSQDEIDFPPFGHRYLMKWDSEVVTEGTTHCPGWRGKRFEVPEDMQNPPWSGIKEYTPPTPLPYQPIDFASLVKTAFGPKPFGSHSQWMKHCHYFSCLWSPLPELAASGLKQSVGKSSSSTTRSDFSDYGTGSEHSYTTDTEPSKRDSSPILPFARKRSRTEDLTRPDDHSFENKRVRRSKSLESVAKYETDPTTWTTRRIGGLGSPSSLSKSKGKEREQPPLTASPRETSSETDLPTLAELSPNLRKSAGSATRSIASPSRRRALVSTDSHRSSPSTSRTRVSAPPRDHRPQPRSERKCSVIVKDGDEEDKVWFMSKQALQDVKGYLQVKKAVGAAIEVRSGGDLEGDVRHSPLRVERAPRSSSTRLARKRGSGPYDKNEEAQKPKRRRSWPEINPFVSKTRTGSLPCSG